MKRSLSLLIAFTAGALVAMVAFQLRPVQAMPAPVSTETPTPTAAPTQTLTPLPSPTASPTAIPAHAAASTFGWTGEIRCINCVPVTKHVEVHHYNPMKGKFNCFTWSEALNWCMSPTSSGLDWQAVWGIAAACPIEWGMGPWIEIPEVGNFICLDHGDLIFCQADGSLCFIDLLGPGGAAWDGKQFDATLWIPRKPGGN